MNLKSFWNECSETTNRAKIFFELLKKVGFGNVNSDIMKI